MEKELNNVIFISDKEIQPIIKMKEIIQRVEEAIKRYTMGLESMPSKIYLECGKGDFRAMPATYKDIAGIKWVSVFPEANESGLPTVSATILLCDKNNGRVLSMLDGTTITAYRTAATSAIASKYLTNPKPKTIGFVGAGKQAQIHLLSHINMFQNLQEFKVYDINSKAIDNFFKYANTLGVKNVKFSTLQETCYSDILCTTTPSRKGFIKSEYIDSGTHINAVGADSPGKQEFCSEFLAKKNVKIYVDDYKQAKHSGEINVPLKKGIIKHSKILGTLGEIITNKVKGRESSLDITLFDATGLAIEDISVAEMLYTKITEKAK